MRREESARHYHVDVNRMLDLVAGFPNQVADAWEMSRGFEPPTRKIDAPLIVCGMGGSAIGGELLRDLVRLEATVPVLLVRGYTLPVFASRKTPVICVSFSGNTEEVLSTFQEALTRGCPVAVITSGGKLAEEATRAGASLLVVPDGRPPRAALGYLFTPLLRLASKWGIYPVTDREIETAVRKTRRLTKKYLLDSDPANNAALELARRLYGKIPLIYSGGGLLSGAAYRWKCQFNENSKCMAFSNTFSELGHNEVMGWDANERIRRDIFLIMLKDYEDYPRVQKRMAITFTLLEPLAGGAVQIDSKGEKGRKGRLARLFSIITLGDFSSVYLAVEYGKDPTPIEKIERIKQELRSEDA